MSLAVAVRPTVLLGCALCMSVAPATAQEPARLTAVANALLEAHVPHADDPDALARQLIETATHHAASATSALLIEEARRLLSSLQKPAECLSRIEGYLSANPHGLGAHEAKKLKTELLRRNQTVAEARAVGAYENHASALLAVGPFGDSGNYYTGVVFPPELIFPASSARLVGRYGPVQVRVVKRRPLRSQIDLAPTGGHRDGCFYGLHQTVIDSDTSCYVEVACRGSFDLFVNGTRSAVIDRHAQRLPSVLRLGISLRKGRNHVLVKTTLNGMSAVGLRYLDGAGRPVRGLSEYDGPGVQPHVAPRADPPVPEPFPDGLRLLSRAAGQAEGGHRHRLLEAAALTAFRWRDLGHAMQLLHELEKDPPPEQGLAGVVFAKLLEDATPIPAEIRRSRARPIIEANAEALADHHHVTLQRARFLEDQDRREDAVRLLEGRVRAGLAGPSTFDRLHKLLSGLSFAAEARRLRSRWREVAPLDLRPTMAEAAERSRGGDMQGALSLLTTALKTSNHDTLRRSALALAQDLGEAELTLQLVEELHALDPDAVRALQDRATALRKLGRQDEAVELHRRIAHHEDASAPQVKRAADELLRAGHRAAARTSYARSLELDPSQHQLRRLLDRLAGEEEFAALARFRRDGDEIIARFVPAERERSSSSSLLLDQMIVQVFEDGSMVEEIHQIRRINDLRGVEKYQEAKAAAGADEVVRLRTVGTDGKSYVPNRVGGTFGMPRLEPGACIDEVHRSYAKSPQPGPWRGPEFHFRSQDEPFLLSELVVILPKTHPGSFRVRNFAGKPEVVPLAAGSQAHVFRQTDVPRLPTERHPPPLEEVVPVVIYGQDGHPEAAARRDRAAAARRSITTPRVAEETARVVAGCDSDLEKTQAIHRFVHEAIAPGRGSTDPTAILMHRRGPRFFLEAAMLGLAGVPFRRASVAASREELNDAPTPFFVGTEDYDVPAVRVEPRGAAALWLFAGSPRYAPLGFVPHERLGAAALLLEEGGAELTRLPRGHPEELTGFSVQAAIGLESEGGATMQATSLLRGASGYRASDHLRTVEENLQQVIARQVAGRIFPGWTLREVELEGLEEKGLPLAVRVQLKRGRALEPAGGTHLLSLPLGNTDFLARFGDRGGRTLPLRLSAMTSSAWEVTVDPRPHYRFVEVPAPVRVRHMLIDFNLTFRRDGEKLVIHRDVVQRPGTILPSQYTEWLELLRRLDLAEDANLKLIER